MYLFKISLICLCLPADITTSSRSPTVGQDLTYWCKYPNGANIKKFICKGEDPSVCQRLVSTAQRNMNIGRFSMEDDTTKANITVTIRNMRLDDTGTYWCGADSTDPGHSDEFFHKLLITQSELANIATSGSLFLVKLTRLPLGTDLILLPITLS
uniref:Immunoglobulin V-set domain-containing protein n=1 Tax=Mastacembelus armatus TaxID=205130 RepID=A0A3Q3S5J9_9TELE